ncbi:MAG: RagB/SusD family nutrient uptake outer membrane protein [Saprospiraceae bacterium]|nr:RagB/SusD family nutrient uptake outer membrane protein [Saprospiraceae bacterium]
MKFYKIIYLLLLVFAVGCEGDLELEPEQSISGDVAVTSESNIENILIGAYDEAGQGASYGGQLQMMADLLGSGEITSWSGTFSQPREVKNKTMLADNTFVRNFWNNAYEVINQTNLVINNVDIISSDTDKKNRIEGEAKFLRALNYFDLVRHFSSGTKGVPIRTEGILDYSGDLSIARNSVSEAYSLIVSDLESAISLLPEENGFFADKYAAQALLARVQLQQGNFAAARDAANSVIANSGHSLTSSYASAFNNDADSSEDIFAFQVTSQTGTNQLVTFYADEGNGGRGGDVTITDAYVSLFESGDERGFFFYPSGQSGERLTSKYTNEFANIALIRLAEMYLIRAEANLEAGTTTGDTPLNDVNAVRARAGAPALSSVTVADVLNERVLELAFEGFSIHDVFRTQGSVDGYNYDAPELVMPIPQAEMDTNAQMEQNPGY